MKTVDIQDTNLDACVFDAQSDRVIITRGGNPVALVVGVEGLDAEQAQCGGPGLADSWRGRDNGPPHRSFQ